MTHFALSNFEEKFPLTSFFIDLLLKAFPQHTRFIHKRFSILTQSEERNLEYIAQMILDLKGGELDSLIDDYDSTCQLQIKEEIFFRRNNNQYRLKTLEEVNREVYSQEDIMKPYINGLLMSQLFWSNHTQMLCFYRENFLFNNPSTNYSHLEVGPGHGILLTMASVDTNTNEISGWDISPSSIDATRIALKALKINKTPTLQVVDLLNAKSKEFDSIVFSEVLEHMEQPDLALLKLHSCLSEKGRMFINVPVNSPAPDHLFNKNTPDEMKDFIESYGFKVEESLYSPLTNYSLKQAEQMQLTISCGFIVSKA